MQTRYKQPPFADGRSWALVTFKDIAAVRRAMKQKVIIPEFTEATGMPVGQEDRMTELVRLSRMDSVWCLSHGYSQAWLPQDDI